MQENKKNIKKILKAIVTTFLSACFALAGIFAVVVAIFICTYYLNEKPILVTEPETAVARVTGMMDAACDGDYARMSTYILGDPDIGVSNEEKDAVGTLIWESFQKSQSYELVGECYTTEAGLAQNVRFTCLDAESITSNLRQQAQSLLQERVENAEDLSQIVDENNEYREEFVSAVLKDAVVMAIEENAEQMTVEFVVNLRYLNGEWWIVADAAMMDVLFGDILF